MEDKAFQLIQSNQINVLQVSNLLSEYKNREILNAAQGAIDAGFTKFVVDLDGMPYTNSVGLNFLISLQARGQDREGMVVIANVSKKIIQLLEITKLHPLFHLTDSVKAGLLLINKAETQEDLG